jgi:hypothetical protein
MTEEIVKRIDMIVQRIASLEHKVQILWEDREKQIQSAKMLIEGMKSRYEIK